MRVPDYFEPITAYRAWTVRDNGLLCGRHVSEPWPVKQPLVAHCTKGDRAHLSNQGAWKPAPVRGCSCGVHAYHSPEQAKAEQGSFWGGSFNGAIVFGTVKLWGRVLEHERGFRAEFGYPSELVANSDDLARKLQVYGVPVRCEAPVVERDENLYDVLAASFKFWQASPVMTPLFSPMRYGVIPSISPLEQPPETPLLWTPTEDDRSPLAIPQDTAKERRSVQVWREIAHGHQR